MANLTVLKKDAYDKLKAELLHAADRYYNHGDSPLSDLDYDMIVDRLKRMEAENPTWVEADSPTRVVGAAGGDVVHEFPMLSLKKIKTRDEVFAFWRTVATEPVSLLAMWKADGVSLSLTYVGGKLVLVTLRGDGKVGKDVTEHAKYITGIPQTLARPINITVRGEAITYDGEFTEFVQKAFKLKNARNAVAGALNSNRPEDCKSRRVRFVAFDALSEKLDDTALLLKGLETLGFEVVPWVRTLGAEDTIAAIERMVAEDKPYQCDGVVIKVNSGATRRKLGTNTNTPVWAVAFKPEAVEFGISTLYKVTYDIGKSGKISLVGHIDPPVDVEGVTISKASLHNISWVRERDFHIGDTVKVIRANSVIPRIEEVVSSAGRTSIITPPHECPSCTGEVECVSGTADEYFCRSLQCSSQTVRRLTHWCSRAGVNIDSLSSSWLERLVEAGLVTSPADLYFLTMEQLMSLGEGMGKARAQKFLDEIEKSKSAGMRKILIGFAIPSASTGTCERLCKNFSSVQEVANLGAVDFWGIDDIGPVVADSIANYFSRADIKDVLARLEAAGMDMTRKPEDAPIVVKDATGPFVGKKVCVTGKTSIPRDELHKLIVQAGGIVASGVSSKTDILIIGENVGKTKTDKARQHGTEVITEDAARKAMNL